VFRLRDKLTKSFNLFKDRICSCSPNERLGILVIVMDELSDFANQISNAPKSSPANRFLSDDVEPDLDLIKPGCICWGIMNMVSWAGC